MDPEFQRVLVPVLIGGTTVMAIGVIAIVMIFRAFAAKKPASSIVLMVALSTFVMLCCAGLFILSYR